jgi:type IV pilus biogenesis protein CpaD/CtpE
MKRHIAIIALLALAGCQNGIDVSTPSQVNVRNLRVVDATQVQALDARAVDKNAAQMAAAKYLRSGTGTPVLLLPYAENDVADSQAVRARGDAYKNIFAAAGVPNLRLEYAAVTEGQDKSAGVLSYPGLQAKAPEGCRPMPGHDGAVPQHEFNGYPVGCEIQQSLSLMIADPSDLLGKGGSTQGDSRREGVMVEKYKSGMPNERLQGLNSSDVAGGGK